MYVNNTNILLLIYNVYNYDYSFGENKNKRTLIVSLKETRNFSKYIVLCAKKVIYINGRFETNGHIRYIRGDSGKEVVRLKVYRIRG